MSFVSYAQNFEDVLLWRALGHVEHGSYVDVGAQDPVIDSVSLAFYERGWRGINIEPSPQYATKLRALRPDEIIIEAVVASKPGSRTFFEVRGTGLGTADRAIAERHRSAGFEVTERSVECRTLTQLLAPFAGREIHWMKIDVEGLEREVIEGWDAGVIRPWIVIIEATSPLTDLEVHDGWEPLILLRGYDLAFFDGLNRYYVSKDHGELVRRINYPANVFDEFELSGGASNTFTKGLERRISALSRLEAELETARESQARLGSELEGARETVRELESSIERLLAEQRVEAERASALKSEANRLADLLSRQQRDCDLVRAELLVTSDQLAERVAEIEAVYRSYSWRITEPLRAISGNLNKVLKGADTQDRKQ